MPMIWPPLHNPRGTPTSWGLHRNKSTFARLQKLSALGAHNIGGGSVGLLDGGGGDDGGEPQSNTRCQ